MQEMQARMIDIARDMPEEVGKALFQFGEGVMNISKDLYVPVDLGNLRGTGHVAPPNFKMDGVEVVLSFGGPGAEYALKQHETLHFKHNVGEAKYLEKPLKIMSASLRGFMRGKLGFDV
jgi:hypothetical protein